MFLLPLTPGRKSCLAPLVIFIVLWSCLSCTERHSTQHSSLTKDEAMDEYFASNIIARQYHEPGSRQVFVEINYSFLESLTKRPEARDVLQKIRGPVSSSRLFAKAIHVVGPTDFTLGSQDKEVGEASGLFTATVQVKAIDRTLSMRMVAEPSDDGQPTIWLLNDYNDLDY